MNAGQFARRLALIERERGRSRHYARKAVASLVREAKAILIIMHGRLTGWRLPNGQVVCSKQRHRTEADAIAALAAVHDCPRTKRIQHRHYQCPHCHGWHLTSQPKTTGG